MADPSVAFRLDLVGEIPSDTAVREAVQKRQLLLEMFPGSEAAKGIGAVAVRLAAP
jgi:flagellar biosynthesis protein FlhG